MAKNSSPSRAPKNGAQLWDNPEQREKCVKTAEEPVPPPYDCKVEIMSRFQGRTAQGSRDNQHDENM